MTNDTKTPTQTLPQGWPPEQPTVEVGTLLRLAKWGVAGVGLCLVLLASLVAVLVLDRRDANEARERLINILAAKER